MSRLLHVEVSPRGAQSFSSRVAGAFLDEYRRLNPRDEIEHLRLFEHALPAFDAEAAGQKMEHIGRLVRGEGALAPAGKWGAVVAEIERLKAADKVLISTPMWNFSLPYPLKHYLDVVIQPGLTFYVNRQGEYVGMLGGKPLQLIIASGSAYRPGFPGPDDGIKTDFMEAYLRHVACWIGLDDIRVIRIQPTAHGTLEVIEALAREHEGQARSAARGF